MINDSVLKTVTSAQWFEVSRWCHDRRVSPFDNFWYQTALKETIIKELKMNKLFIYINSGASSSNMCFNAETNKSMKLTNTTCKRLSELLGITPICLPNIGSIQQHREYMHKLYVEKIQGQEATPEIPGDIDVQN